ncbi:Swt1 family HEPN domain-containing protein [Fluviicola sp.]|uniref:Swt1 family HEPN domain-containing protein n=1 Tax=Fluviicola sp. TaxID=1917219 RepID=UPI0031CE3475
MQKDTLEIFCERTKIQDLTKLEIAIGFIWFHSKITGDENGCDASTINEYFSMVSLPKYNPTYLKRDLQKSRRITKGAKTGLFKLVRSVKLEYDQSHGSLFESQEPSVSTSLNLLEAPFIELVDVQAAHKMAELYVIIHCYENSARRLIENTLTNTLGSQWWDQAANSSMSKKYTERKQKEEKNKWLSPRGAGSPLYYLDWSDLVSIIRKFPDQFSAVIHDIKFVELRLEELEKTRNIVAHNGVLPSEDDFQRVILSFKDCVVVN